jgi:hypothetical protein
VATASTQCGERLPAGALECSMCAATSRRRKGPAPGDQDRRHELTLTGELHSPLLGSMSYHVLQGSDSRFSSP